MAKPQSHRELIGARRKVSRRLSLWLCVDSVCSVGSREGFTLIEMMMGASIIVVVVVALMGAFLGQSSLNVYARNLTAAMNDATRVMEQIRQQNIGAGCTAPSARPPAGYNSWNAWLADPNGGGGKSIPQPAMIEHVAVTCQDEDGGRDVLGGAGVQDYCGPDQVSALEWRFGLALLAFNPIRVTVAVGWRADRRVIGGAGGSAQEFAYLPGQTVTTGKNTTTTSGSLRVGPDTDANNNGIIESQAMLTTLVTCR